MTKIMMIGAGGHARVILDSLIATGQINNLAWFTDENVTLHGKTIEGISIVGNSSHWQAIFESGVNQAIVAIGDNRLRKQNVDKLTEIGFQFPVVIHPHAWVSPGVTISKGTVVMAGAVIQSQAVIEGHCIINTSSSIDHDCHLEPFVHCAPGSHLGGNVHIQQGTLIGIGSAILPGITIGSWSTIGAGSVVIRDIPAQSKAYGNPAKVVCSFNQPIG